MVRADGWQRAAGTIRDGTNFHSEGWDPGLDCPGAIFAED